MNHTAVTGPEHSFYCADGSVLRTLQQLERKLRTISAEAYSHHTAFGRNDFYNWIRDVFGDEHCGRAVLAASTNIKAADVIKRALSSRGRRPHARKKASGRVAVKKKKRRTSQTSMHKALKKFARKYKLF
jgi:hypothetical protein